MSRYFILKEFIIDSSTNENGYVKWLANIDARPAIKVDDVYGDCTLPDMICGIIFLYAMLKNIKVHITIMDIDKIKDRFAI
ncbi:hypothetical protein A3Q56_01225 [Intoshia linei]|uniref:Uncharacterized protein n=1 Tax=Intoshia linei TaxID=1819745 RepID=A0A177B9M3_9BILA|nr:hypothetical protein A3Q56_01225 [Intoshia linei]